MSDKIHVVIIDDHPIFRDGVARTLDAEVDVEVVGQGDSADDALRLTRDLLPDILVLDIDIPGGGIAAAEGITASYPVTKIVMLTASDDEEHLITSLRAGAKAYILKGVAARELVTILRNVWSGEVYVTPSLATSLLLEMTGVPLTQRTLVNPMDELTEREHQILELVAAGASNKEIGLTLHLTEKTVKHYMTNILQKLQVRNRVEAAMLAYKSSQMATKQ